MKSSLRFLLLAMFGVLATFLQALGGQDDVPGCRVLRRGDVVELHSPFFVYRLDTASGLRARTWENRLTGGTISLGGGSELELDIAEDRPRVSSNGELDPSQWRTLDFCVSELPSVSGPATNAVFELRAADCEMCARVTYRWDATEPVLRKLVDVVNDGKRDAWLLNVRLGTYRTQAKVVDRERGFPAYLDDQFFVGLAHPAGWATVEQEAVSLRHYPGVKLAPGAKFECMETVYGVAHDDEARRRFVAHVRSRMRRVVRGHDGPYAIFEPFGARPGGNFDETEEFVLDMIQKVAEGQQQSGCRFDLFSVDFWVDYHGDLKGCDPQRFPNGLTQICEQLRELGIAPGLWIDSSGERWSIGGNPQVRPCLNHDPQRAESLKEVPWGRASFCRATEPIRSMYTEAFRHHIRDNGVRLLKFDNLATTCVNPQHEHLPGIYSTEPIVDSVIEFLHAMDQECPDVFLMLYWGHRSPWWLLHADTLFDSGIKIEAASPSDFPAPYARGSITQKLDQAQRHAQDVPALGKDSLGVWLSDWGWNSSVGKRRWQEGFVMDMCRGSLLAQPWSDTAWLSPPERKQMANFFALLKARPDCFGNPRFILGDPWNGEPYGYCCTDGSRAFLAINNCGWEDRSISLRLNSTWGLPDGRTWDLYRWYPDPAELKGDASAFGEEALISLRPFEVVLLEVVPAGEAPSLDRQFEACPIPTAFAEASQPVEVAVEKPVQKPAPADVSIWTPLEILEARSDGGATLALQEDGSLLAGGKTPSPDTYTIKGRTEVASVTGILLEVLPHPSLPGNGPGRAVNGNFMLNEFRVKASPQDDPSAAVSVRLRNPATDFFQTSHGGWPVAATIDGDPSTGWSIDPAEGIAHVALFETEKPVDFAGGTDFVFTIEQGEREHTLGRFRLSVTRAKPPLPLPQGFGAASLVVKGTTPASQNGGMLVITVGLKRVGKPRAIRNLGAHLSAQGTLAGKPAEFEPVLGKATYPAAWQAWRLTVEPSPRPQPFELSVSVNVSADIERTWKGHFIAR